MHRFFVPANLIQAGKVVFPVETAHQIRRVLRLTAGTPVGVLDGSGMEYTAELDDVDENKVAGRIVDQFQVSGEPAVRLTMLVGLTQREKLEWVLQKGTEIGAAEFVFFTSTRTLVQSTKDSERKLERWHAIVREAAEQSGRGRLPAVLPPVTFASALVLAAEKDLALIAWEEEQMQPLGAAVQGRPSSAALMIGPEGGFSVEEITQARLAGLTPVSLGKRVLRMETAALVGAALLLHELEGE